MELSHPAEALTNALIDAIGYRLPDIEYQYQTPMDRRDGKPMQTKTRRPEMRDVSVRMFPQTWGNTALGFGGWGGASATPAYTVIVSTHTLALVYWAGAFAYGVVPDEAFMNDVFSERTVEHAKAASRYKMVECKR